MVYTGILPIARNEAGLATVLGHEIAHATSRHGAQRVFQQNAVQMAMMGIQGSMSDLDPQAQRQFIGMLGAGAQYGVLLPDDDVRQALTNWTGTTGRTKDKLHASAN